MLPFWNPNQLLPMGYVYVPLPISYLRDFPFCFYNFSGFSNSQEFLNFQIPTAPFQANFHHQFVVDEATTSVVAVTNPPAPENTVIHDDEKEKRKKFLERKLKNRPKIYRTEKRIHQAESLKKRAESPRRLRSRNLRKQLKKPPKQVPETCRTVQQDSVIAHRVEQKNGEGLTLPFSLPVGQSQMQDMEAQVMVNSSPRVNPDGIVNQRKESKNEEMKLLSVDV